MSKKYMIARVIIDHYHNKLDHLFDYLVPTALQAEFSAGMRVLVPFGKNNRMLEAFVMEMSTVENENFQMKEIVEILDREPVLTASTLLMINWMKSAYYCRAIEAIRCFVPNQKVKKKIIDIVSLKEDNARMLNIESDFNNAPAQKRIVTYLIDNGDATLNDLITFTETSHSSIKSLISKDLVSIRKQQFRRIPNVYKEIPEYPEPTISKIQRSAINRIEETWSADPNKHILLHGITGSGKTEIYMQLIKNTLAKGLDSILLVPEIALTPQMVQRFKGRFGNKVAVLHSHLSDGEKLDEWNRIKSKEANIVIGPRSAVFAPCKNIGTIIIDEEHETTYKSEQAPRYHAIDVAKMRCEIEGAHLLLGSATPSMESYFDASKGNLKLIELNERATGGKLPEVTTIDLRKEVKLGNKTLFSKRLVNELSHCLANGHQAILFLNRRAFATYVNCLHCGHIIQCVNCDITMKWHKNENKLKCHYCNSEIQAPRLCPECGEELTFQGAGTQRAEDSLETLFPDHRIVRMDQDTTRKKGSHQEILGQFASGKIHVLIGTQMIAKGLDFPNVTLVGILLADTSINLPDFRASERTFQLITQVAGRSGRGEVGGKVILQTYQPCHYAVCAASKQDYKQFYEEEIQVRHTFQYPPYSRLIQLTFSGEEAQEVKKTADRIAAGIRFILQQSGQNKVSEIVLGPGPAGISRVDNKYRYTLLLKSVNVRFSLLRKVVKYLVVDKKDDQIPADVLVVIDPDPRFIQ